MPLDLDKCLYLDFEARSELDITEVGARVYAEHPSTELLCCGWVIGLQDPVNLWLPEEPIPPEWTNHRTFWVAHNKDTERFLLQYKLGMVILSMAWIDCATVTSAAGMPRNLHDVGASLNLEVQKQSKTPLLALSRPRKLSKKNGELWWTVGERPETYAQLYEYCKGDTDVMRKALAALPPYHWVMPAKEERLAVLTDKMNDHGVEVDLIGVERAREVVEAHGAKLRARFSELFPGVNPKHPPSVSAALGIDNARKETVRDELKRIEAGWTGYEADRHEALTVLKTIKTASTAKLKAFQRHACADGRVRGAMVFHGAGRTGRWSSMGVQLHNLVRGLGSGTPDWPAIDTSPDAMDTYFEMLHAGLLDLAYSDPTRATAAAMRGFLLDSRDGLLSGDFSQIEARALVTWARQTDMVEAFRQKKDPYKLMASRIYGIPIEQVNEDQRFMGKQSVLGAGYGVGRFGFANMLWTIYDVIISAEEGGEADRIVQAYRTSNRRVVELWYAVERLAKQTVLEQPQKLICSTDVPLIAMRMVKKWLVIRLPSGRCLWYFEPELVTEGGRSRIYYWGRNIKQGGRWDRVETYGGKLVENVTQAMARDVMADAMLQLDAAGFNVSLTVHDEIVAPGPASRLDEFEAVMRLPPTWWKDLPLDVKVQHKRRYQK
jgi:DNA polymerase